MKKLIVALALAVAIWPLGVVQQAQATSAIDQFFLGRRNRGTGINAEYMINLNDAGGLCDAATGTATHCVDAGDLFIGLFNVNQIFDITGGGGTHTLGANGVNELTGVFALKVLTQTETTDPISGESTLRQTLGPVSVGDIVAAGAQMSPGLATFFTSRQTTFPGTILSVFDDAAVDWTDVYTPLYPQMVGVDDDCDLAADGSDAGIPMTAGGCYKTEEKLLASARGGILRFHLGFTGPDTDADGQPNRNGLGEGFSTKDASLFGSARDLSALKAIPPTSPVGNFAGGLDLIANFTPIQFGKVPTIDTVLGFPIQGLGGFGSGTAHFAITGSDKGGDENGPFDLTSQETITFQPNQIPEPSTLTLMLLGVAALGYGTTVCRKMRK